MQIYLLEDGEKLGPFTVYELASRVREGKADGDSMGWYQGADGWRPLRELPAVETIFVEPPPRVDPAAAERDRFGPLRREASVRFWARLIDITLLGFVIWIGAVFVGVLHPQEQLGEQSFMIQLLPPVAVMLMESFLLHTFGTTPGKWLLRVVVRTEDGSRIPLGVAFKRSFTVWWRGVGLWIFPISLIMMILSQAAFLSDGVTPWDRNSGLKVECGKIERWRIFLTAGLLVGMMVTMSVVAALA